MELYKEKKSMEVFWWTVFIIYITDSMLFATNRDFAFIFIKRVGVILAAIYLFVDKIIIKKNKIDVSLVVLSFSLYASSALSETEGYLYYTMIACLWFGYIFSRETSIESFARYFCKIMTVIAVVSLIGWLLAEQITSIGPIPTITNTSGLKYKNLLVSVIPMNSNHAMRNRGIFWEPGAYQVYLSVALFLTLFVDVSPKKRVRAILFVITCLTTLSGAALVPICLIIIAYTFEKKQFKSTGLAMLLLGVIVILFKTGMFDIILDKMEGNAETNSITFRLISIEGAIKGFLNNPIFGSTPRDNEIIKSQLAMQYMGQTYGSNTNTFLNYFAYFGILVGGFMNINVFKMFINNTKSIIAAILCFLAFYISTSNENMMSSVLIAVLVCYGIKNKKRSSISEGSRD